MTGAEVMVKCLAEQGVTTVFGYPGGAILPFYDALREASDIRHILTAHEQGAAHAADGYARAGGQVGVCIATSGPGATNLVTGLANAFLDSIPVVAITGQVPVAMIGRDAFQEVDITGITMPITKHNFLVKRPEHLAQTIRLAFQLAKTGRPGPVLVDVPRDVQTALLDYEPGELEPLAKELPEEKQIAAAVAVKSEARLVWNTHVTSPNKFTTWDVQIPGNVDKICITKGKYNSYDNNTEKSIARGGTTTYDCDINFTITFQTNGILHVVSPYKTLFHLELWIDGYHYPTLADLLTQVTAVESSVTDLQVALCELYEEKEEN